MRREYPPQSVSLSPPVGSVADLNIEYKRYFHSLRVGPRHSVPASY